jgi:hypothetical protein
MDENVSEIRKKRRIASHYYIQDRIQPEVCYGGQR